MIFDSTRTYVTLNGDNQYLITNFNYDNNGNPTNTISVPFKFTEYSYDIFGNIISKTDVGNQNNSRTTNFFYNNDGRFLTQTISPTGLITEYLYENKYGNLISKTDPTGNYTNYKYDA